VGLYSTIDLNGSPLWQREGDATLGFAVVQSLALRPSDNALLIGTHGNGMYYTFVGKEVSNPNPGNEVFIQFLAPALTSGTINYKIGNLTSVQKIIVRVFNMKGQLLLQQQRAYSNGSINFSPYPAGMYIVSIMSDDAQYKFTQKIIK
jgi:hypothetical protein